MAEFGKGGGGLICFKGISSGRKSSVINQLNVHEFVAGWTSLPVGVVTLAEKFGGVEVRENDFQAMVSYVKRLVDDFAEETLSFVSPYGATQFLGTSGTVTTLAGVHQGLRAYDRRKVDGYWMSTHDVRFVADKLRMMDHLGRIAQPCVGRERADLVVAGLCYFRSFAAILAV